MNRFLQSVIVCFGLFISVAGYSGPKIPAGTITPSGTPAALSTTYGTASSETSFTFTASSLTGATETVTITAPAGFEVSLTSGASFSTSVTKDAVANAIASTTVYVRLAANAGVAGSPYSGDITLSSASATTANVATTASTVNPKALTMTGLAVPASKVYDGTTAAVVSGTPTLQASETIGTGTAGDGKPYTGDVVSITGTPTGTYNSKDVSSAATVTFGGLSLSGAEAGNYTLTTQASTSATVTAKNLTMSGLSVPASKVYDATTDAVVSGTAALQADETPGAGNTSDGKPYTGDVVSMTGTVSGTYNSKNVATAATVTYAGLSLTGVDAGNYSFTIQAAASATITAKALTMSGLSVPASKIYDATTTSVVSGSAALQTAEAPGAGTTGDGIPYTGDVVNITGTATGTYNSKNVATATTVTFSGVNLTGAQAGNYSLTIQSSASATITAKALTMSGLSVPASKIYDATTAAVVSGGTGNLQAAEAAGAGTTSDGKPYTGDVVSITGTATGTYNSKDVATAASVTYNGLSLTGAQSTNYSFTIQSAAAATITKKNLTITGVTAGNKVYNGNTTGSLTGTATLLTAQTPGTGTTTDGNPYTGDALSITGSPTATFASAATIAGATGISVTVAGYTLGGAQAGNYTPVQPTGLTATIYAGEPTGQARNISFTAVTAVSMTVNWATPGSGTPGSSRLVLVHEGTAVSATPADFTSYTASADWTIPGTQVGSGNYVVYNGSGSSVPLTNLNPNTTYHVQIFEYNGAPGSGLENYLTVTATNNPRSQGTNNVDNTATFTGGTGPLTISSISNNNLAPVTAFQFVVTDLGSGDGTSTRFTQLVFRPGTGNQIADWTQIIGGAELFDNIGNGGPVTGNSKHSAAIIGTNTITIPGIDAGNPSKLGSIEDPSNGTATRTYSLKIWLKTSLGGSLPTTVDGQHLAFSISGADATPVASKGAMSPVSTTSSGAANNEVTVTATSIRIIQQPSTTATANVALVTQPIFEAVDANTNRDLLNNALTVGTSNGTINPASAPTNFSSGLADFTSSGFRFANTGTTTMNVSTTSPTLTSANTNSITVTSSTNLGNSTEILASSPLINSSTLNPVLGFSLNTTGSVTNLTDLVFTSTLPPAGYVKNFKLYANTVDSYAGATQVATSSSLTFSGMSVPINSSLKYFFLVCDIEPSFPSLPATIQFSLPAGNFTVSAGGAKTGSTQSSGFYSFGDLTPPDIQSITTASAVNAWSTTNGTSASSVQFTVTFTEPVSGVSATDFRVVTDGTVGYFLRTISGSGSVYTITVSGIVGLGHIRIELEDNNTITDNTGNFFGGPGFTDYFTDFVNAAWYYSIVLPAPSNPIAGVVTTSTQQWQLQLAITHDLSFGQPATHYLVMARESSGATPFPTFGSPTFGDGKLLADDPDDMSGYFFFDGDGLYVTNVVKAGGLGPQSVTLSPVKSGVNYDVIIYPYTINGNYSSDNIDYGTPTTLSNIPISVGNNSTLSGTANPGPIPSTVTAAPGQNVFTFTVTDQAGSTSGDTSPTKFSALTIHELVGLDNVADWSSIIAGAELYDIASPSTFVAATPGNITANQIIFTSIPSTNIGDLGYVRAYEPIISGTAYPKGYGLRIYFKNTAGTLTGFDNSILAFTLSHADFTYNNTSGNRASTQIQSATVSSGTNTIDIRASKLVFTTNPQAQIGVGTTFGNATGTPDPVVQAFDANNNLDTDYNAGFSIISTVSELHTGLTQFTGGILTLTPFGFTAAGSSTITITGNSTGTPFNYPALSGAGVEAVSDSDAGTAGNQPTTAVITGTTTITAATGGEPGTLPSLTTLMTGAFFPQVNAVSNFNFTVTDDVGANTSTFDDNDALPTLLNQIVISQGTGNDAVLVDWSKAIAEAELTLTRRDGFAVGPTSVTSLANTVIGATTITFNNIAFGISQPGRINDGGTNVYTLKITLKNPVDPTIADLIDNKDFVFGAGSAGINIAGGANASSNKTVSSTDSGDGNNKVIVTATRLAFTTQWVTNSSQNYDATLTPNPVAKAQDVNGNLDLDYNTAATVTASGTAPATYPIPPGNQAVTVTNGVLAFDPGLQISSSGNGLNGNIASLTLASGSLTSAFSNTFILNYSGASDIIKDATFTYPSNILYAQTIPTDYQTADITSTTGIALDRFTIRDGGGAADADGSATKLNSITLRVTNYDYLRKIAIYNETSGDEVGEKAVVPANYTVIIPPVPGITPGVADITFSGIPASGPGSFLAPENANPALAVNNLVVKVSFNNVNVIDNQVISFQVTNIAANSVSSAFATTTPVGVQSTVTGNQNKIEVEATQLDFTTPASNASASLNSPFAVVVEARDANKNRDLDFTGVTATITSITNTSGASMAGDGSPTPLPIGTAGSGITYGSTGFTNGVFAFPGSFQFTSGNNNDDVSLSITAGGVSSIPAPSPTTPTITLTSSFESVLKVDPGFLPVFDIPYKDYQDITASATSFPVGQFKLFDGSGSANDLDGAATNINSISFTFENAENIRSLGIYIGSTLVQSRDNVTFSTTAGVSTVDFSSLSSSLVAPDNGSLVLTVRASFYNTASAITDNDPIQLHVVSVTQNGGSQFNTIGTAPLIGGISNGAVSAPLQIEVSATRLNFTSQAAAKEGVNQPITEPVVKAQDVNNVVDLDHNFNATISSTVNVSSSSLTFINGILNFTGFKYLSAGDGTLTVTSNGLSSNTNGSTAATHVDVLNVYTTLATAGVITSPNLAGGAINKVIFGATFNAPYRTGSDPYLNKFVISFSNSISGVLTNFRVFESSDNAFGSDIDITNPSIGGKVTATSNSLTIDFTQSGGVPRNLSSSGSSKLSYFLMVDVDPSANSATPSIIPSITDLGYLDPSTNSNIQTTAGSTYSLNSLANTGATAPAIPYTFAAIFPPTLVKSYPAKGQLNVDPDTPTLDLVFSVPVWTMGAADVSLYDKNTNTLIQTLIPVNGQYAGANTANLAGTLVNPLKFNLPALLPDHVYYVTIVPAKFNGAAASDNVGIMDENANLFAGFSYSGTLYFKTANPNPPVLLSTAPAPPPLVTNISTTSAIINATFDQQGTAYFLVLNSGSTAPTNDQIDGTTAYPGFIARGNFEINQTNTISQFGLISPESPMATSTSYDVWLYAQNNALPTPKPTAAPYGGTLSNYAVGGTGPTMTFTTPPSNSALVSVNNPTIPICAASYQTLNTPIIISEGNNSNFTSSGVQTFNLLLPSGFQYDVNTSGSIVLQGADFVPGSGTMTFINNSILQVSYRNDGRGGNILNPLNSSSDNIIISGLKVQVANAISGSIVRLGGNALTSYLPDLVSMAFISATDAPTINFRNSYSTNTYGTSGQTVTFIPDNYDDPNIAAPLLVQLDPLPPSNDYGPSFFTGNGVNINQLSLTAVTLGSPFNITVTHTDNNGCISNNSAQYTVYDHTKAIGGLLTDYGIINDNFPAPATPASDVKSILYNNVVSNYMISMAADVPTSGQIMAGTDWQALINNSLLVQGASHNPGNNPVSGQLYYDYSFDVAAILNANANSSGAIPEPYDNFKLESPVQGNIYYKGGSLGSVEFTAIYQNIANSLLQFPLKQNVQFFLPAIPIVELAIANRSFLDLLDPLNPVGSGNVNPVGLTNSNKGTPVFCMQGGKINISGFPAASAGTSVGTFTLVDAQSLTPVTLATNGFIDNGNGTATLDPTLITNNHRDIKIIYTYKDDLAPINTQSTGYQIIRIAPNPVASFNVASVISDNTLVPTAFCVGQPINFDATPPISSVSNGTIMKYNWDFSDATNSTGTNPNTISSAVSNVAHTFTQSAAYTVSLIATSDVGCASMASISTLKVGAVPAVAFDFKGVSVADPITFTNKSTIQSGSGLGDGFAQLDWSFGDGSPAVQIIAAPFNAPTVHHYVNPGLNSVNLKVTSIIGCTASLSHSIIVLAHEIPTPTASYLEPFETVNGKWQTSPLPITSSPPNYSSWLIGAPSAGVIQIDPVLNNNTIVRTAATATNSYNPLEKSAFYSPSFDLTQLFRPMISFNSFTQMETGDGVVLQYSIDDLNVADPLKEWFVVGQPGEGVDWFTDQGITSKPGDQTSKDYGWSGSDKNKWVESKHILDLVLNAPRVVFRFALSSAKQVNSDITLEGFALDNFRVGERTRTILLENFTTTNSSDNNKNDLIKSENQLMTTFVNNAGLGTTVVNLNYHIGFTGADPFNIDNPADPSARALYYNVKDVPWAFLDGTRSPLASVTPKFSEWGSKAYDTQTLQLSQSEMEISAPEVKADGSIKFNINVKALYDLPENTILHVAIVERSILTSSLSAVQKSQIEAGTNETNLDYVVKRMLPNALGTRFETVLAKNQTRSFEDFEYYPDPSKLYGNNNDLAIVVFLQHEDTKEIYQTEYLTGFLDPPTVTGVGELPIALEDIALYPNPADNEFTVQLPAASKTDTRLRLADQVGKIVYDSFIPAGSTEKKVNTQDLAAGMYFLQVEAGKDALTRKKVLVVHTR